MEHLGRYRHRRMLLALCGLACLGQGAAAQERAGSAVPDETRLSEPARFSEGFELRTTTDTNDLGGREDLAQPLDPSKAGQSQAFNQDLRQVSAPARDNPAEPSVDPSLPLDLFAGPAQSRRENLPQERGETGRADPAGRKKLAAGPITAGDPKEVALPPAELFRPIGPVRSPTLDETSSRRLGAGLDGLRRSLPIAADDPFAPVGTRVGGFILYPVIEQSLGASDNLTNSLDGTKGAFSQTSLSARLLSDWSRHAAEINAAAIYRRNFAGSVDEEPQVDVDGRLRLDLAEGWTGTLRGAFSFSRDDGLLTGQPVSAANQADVFAYSGSAELARDIGRANAALTLQAVREDRNEGIFSNSIFAPDDSFTTYTAGLRAGYDLGSPLTPFLSGSVGRRLFDDANATGLSRDSLIPALRAGVTFDLGEKLSGELALGYAWNQPEENSFETTAAPTIDAAINWSPRRGTDVVMKAATFFEPDASGFETSTLYQGTLGIRHRATARIDLEGQLVGALRNGDDGVTERTYAAETGLTYWLNRQLAIIGRYRYDRFEGVSSGTDYNANTVRLGVRVQR